MYQQTSTNISKASDPNTCLHSEREITSPSRHGSNENQHLRRSNSTKEIHIEWSVSISIKFKQINLIRQPCEITDVSFVRSLCSLATPVLPLNQALLSIPAWNEAFGKRAWAMSHFGWYVFSSVHHQSCSNVCLLDEKQSNHGQRSIWSWSIILSLTFILLTFRSHRGLCLILSTVPISELGDWNIYLFRGSAGDSAAPTNLTRLVILVIQNHPHHPPRHRRHRSSLSVSLQSALKVTSTVYRFWPEITKCDTLCLRVTTAAATPRNPRSYQWKVSHNPNRAHNCAEFGIQFRVCNPRQPRDQSGWKQLAVIRFLLGNENNHRRPSPPIQSINRWNILVVSVYHNSIFTICQWVWTETNGGGGEADRCIQIRTVWQNVTNRARKEADAISDRQDWIDSLHIPRQRAWYREIQIFVKHDQTGIPIYNLNIWSDRVHKMCTDNTANTHTRDNWTKPCRAVPGDQSKPKYVN